MGTARHMLRARGRTQFAIALACVILLACTGAFAAPMQFIETPHYSIRTDIPDPLAHALARRMEMMYGEYSRRLADFSNTHSDQRMLVYLFERHEDYNDFTHNKAPNTGGIFMPERKVLAAYYEGQGRDVLRRTLQHEAFHQFAFNEISPNLPPWLNEGLAVLFQEGIWIGDKFELGEVAPRRVRQLNADMAAHRLTRFADFMTMSNDRWTEQLGSQATLGAAQYNQAWAMVHFLVFAHKDGQFTYRTRFIQMLQLIHDGVDAQEAFDRAFSNNIPGFESRFLEWASTITPTTHATMIERLETLGDLLIELDHSGRHYDDIDEFRKDLTSNGYRLSYAKGDVRWTSEADPAVYFTAPNGHPLSDTELYFAPRSGTPCPTWSTAARATSGCRCASTTSPAPSSTSWPWNRPITEHHNGEPFCREDRDLCDTLDTHQPCDSQPCLAPLSDL